jgi:4-hydroxy-tetrahydrodipicolinate synthase
LPSAFPIIGVSNLTTDKTSTMRSSQKKQDHMAVMIIPMSYWKLTDDEIVEHYDTVASKISIPIITTTTRRQVV